MVYRTYVEKKKGFDHEAEGLRNDLSVSLGIKVSSLRIINRYDVEGISRELFDRAVESVFSEKAVDTVLDSLPPHDMAFAVCPLPGQFDLRSQSAVECISFLDTEAKARVKAAKVYLIDGIGDSELSRIKQYLINPVEAMEDSLDEAETLERNYELPADIAHISGFREMDDEALRKLHSELSLAMDLDDLMFLQDHFRAAGREPTITEVRVCDTYWSDHCRHTTFQTELEDITFEDAEAQEMFQRYLEIRKELGITKPVTLMDLATIGARHLKSRGLLEDLDESGEINACSVNIRACFEDGGSEDYLLMFKNETHNHPTEIEPFGGAATCIGGAIRDPLSGRAYVYQAMRITGSGDVFTPFDQTPEGKLPQKKIAVTSAQGYSSYGNQIGLATGLVDELYHPGYVAKHMELGAVIAAVPRKNVVRLEPQPGDAVILVGGRTGRDGIGGATGSSKSHKSTSKDTSGAEVQKGNAPEERKLQRLFRKPEAQRLIRRCNDFGAGGVAVAIGELAPGLDIDLDKVPRKYQGLDGTELAISESQERMAVVVADSECSRFIELAASENLEATKVAVVSSAPVLSMKWNGREIVHLERSFLDTNGARKRTSVLVAAPRPVQEPEMDTVQALSSLRFCSRQGLGERFDSTIGAGTVLMPYGGKYQRTAEQVMCALLPADGHRSVTASLFSYGCDPQLTDADPFRGAYNAVVESVAKIVAAGGSRKGTHLSLQEFFGRTAGNKEKWGRPLAALLGALKAQEDLSVAAIGGKDSMSGTFEDIDVPNTLVSFAVNTIDRSRVISKDMKKAGSMVYLLTAADGETVAGFLDRVETVISSVPALSAALVEGGRTDVTIAKMCFGSMTGFHSIVPLENISTTGFIIESDKEIPGERLLGYTDSLGYFDSWTLEELYRAYESVLEPVYPRRCTQDGTVHSITAEAGCMRPHCRTATAKPRVLIPVFPGTNCELDTESAFREAGAEVRTFIVNNLDENRLAQSISDFARLLSGSQILFIPGGFSGGDEPDGSGKFITCFLQNPRIREEIERLLGQRDGLVGGICNGFQALVKLGLLPYGEFRKMEDDSPTLTFNRIARHQSRLVHTRVSSLLSPWLSNYQLGQVQMVPVSHGEGRFAASDDTIASMIRNGQICTQYTTPDGLASMDIADNPNGSAMAIEGICSPDGRVFGRMGHVERCRIGLYRNVEMSSSLPFFSGAVQYFL